MHVFTCVRMCECTDVSATLKCFCDYAHTLTHLYKHFNINTTCFMIDQEFCQHLLQPYQHKALLQQVALGVKMFFNYTGQATCINIPRDFTVGMGNRAWDYQVMQNLLFVSSLLLLSMAKTVVVTVLAIFLRI